MGGYGLVCLVCLVHLVYLVGLVQLVCPVFLVMAHDETDRIDQIDQTDLLTRRTAIDVPAGYAANWEKVFVIAIKNPRFSRGRRERGRHRARSAGSQLNPF